MEQSTKLVKQGDLQEELDRELSRQKDLVGDYKKILEVVQDVDLKRSIQARLTKAQEVIAALEAGFVPIDPGWFIDVKTKSKWGSRDVKEILDRMPEEVKEAWKRVDGQGIFKKFSVSGRRGGDPMLVGTAGGRRFLIAAWIDIRRGYSIGMVVRASSRSDVIIRQIGVGVG